MSTEFNNLPTFSVDDIQNALAVYVLKNPDKREDILKDPKGFIEKEFGISFDKKFNIQVIDQKNPNDIKFVLPCASSTELADEDLENVAGGVFLGIAGAIAVGIAAGTAGYVGGSYLINKLSSKTE